jgi:hypothetical protein
LARRDFPSLLSLLHYSREKEERKKKEEEIVVVMEVHWEKDREIHCGSVCSL